MRRRGPHHAWAAPVAMFISQLAQAGARMEQQAAGMTYGSAFDAHPVASMFAHIIFLALIVGVGASIVAALFKSPFRR